jgi:hypothetical protein
VVGSDRRSLCRKSDLRGACDAWLNAVNIRRHIASLPHVAGPYVLAALARALRGLSDALNAAAQAEESQAANDEAQRIWAELGLPNQNLGN